MESDILTYILFVLFPVEALMEQHKHTLDQIYKMKHENFTPKKVRVKPNDKESKNKQKQSVFVQVQKLGPKDTFVRNA